MMSSQLSKEKYAMKNVCFFGIYDSNYARNRVLISGFKANGYAVTECKVDPRRYPRFKKYLVLVTEHRKIHQQKFDYVIVAFPGHTVVWLARLLFGKKIIFDAFLSLYDSNVSDRKLYDKYCIRALRDFFCDWYACLIADKILLDTQEHINYFTSLFNIPAHKFVRVPIGADEISFYPRKIQEKHRQKIIHFHGMFIPLQGIEIIIGAAELASNEEWKFCIVGSGQEYAKIRNLVNSKKLSNVELVGKVSVSAVPEFIASSNVCLGIFGLTEKARRVIPNKVYECIAMGKPVLTADTPAMREYFTPNENIFFCAIGNPKDLYGSLKRILNDPGLTESVSHGGQCLFRDKFSARSIVSEMIKCIHYE